MDFTIKTYVTLLEAFISAGYSFQTFEEYHSSSKEGQIVIMRHDVDEFARNALKLAKVEYQLGIRATYYFRVVRQSNQPEIIKQIAVLGHEIGYHYEDLASAKGNLGKAKQLFEENLNYFRTFYPVKTVCMHGSSTSIYDNRLLWSHFKLADFGLIGEPYLSTNFNDVYYITDTGYAWDGGKYAVRDVVENKFGLSFHSTKQIIESVKKGEFPQQSLILVHTLWTDNIVQWTFLHLREFVRNNIKYLAQRNRCVKRIYATLVKLYWGK